MYVITGGGTGGHLAIAKALAIELKQRKKQVIYIGSLHGQDQDWFKGNDLFCATYFLQTTGIVNKKGMAKIQALLLQIKALFRVKKIFDTHEVQKVISVGGFSAGPASIGAILFKKELFIHEQNAIKGKLNTKLTPFANKIFGSFEDDAKHFVQTSYPVRKEFFTQAKNRMHLQTILFLGGSQGAVAINDFAQSIALTLVQRGFKIIHQCGLRDLERMKKKYQDMGILDVVDLFDFSKDLLCKIVQADCCVCRAGASSVWELAANGLPCLYIPYPYAAKNHQYHNALFFEQRGLGMIVEQKDLQPSKIFDFIEQLEPRLTKVSQELQRSIKDDGARVIIDAIL